MKSNLFQNLMKKLLLTAALCYVFFSVLPSPSYAEIISHKISNPKGAVVLVHGLNINQQSLSELITFFNEEGFSVVTPILSGHSNETYHDASLKVWMNEYKMALQEAQTIAGDKPIFVCGYSLGAALAVLQSSKQYIANIKGLILLSPPLSLRTPYWLARPLLLFKYLHISLPSIAPKEYRVLSTLSLYTFSALFNLEEKIETLTPSNTESNLYKTPTLAFIRDFDEFSSSDSVISWIQERHLTNWKIIKVDDSESTAPLTHLLIDQKSFGLTQWRKFKEETQKLLSQQGP